MKDISRRVFLQGSSAALVGSSTVGQGKGTSPSDKVVLGIMGCGGRGVRLLNFLMQRDDVAVKYLCDADSRRFGQALEELESAGAPRATTVTDFRKILDDPEIDAFFNATPDHWHALATVMACQAGKDVYVEKPLAVDINEGKKMVEAARKYDRVVQVGTQTRSAAYVREAREYIQSGGLGEVHMVRVCNMMEHPPRPQGPERPIPQGLDWDLWCGPAPLLAYSPGGWWSERWALSCGGIFGDAIHQLDLARMMLNLGCPSAVSQVGGVQHFKDGREIPDTQIATYEFGNITMVFEAGLWMPYMKKIPNTVRDSDQLPEWRFCSTHVEILGTEAMMFFGRQGGGWQVFNVDNTEPVLTTYGRQADQDHISNFIDCIRSRERPVADIEEGHRSTLLAHLANTSYRVGNMRLLFDSEKERYTNCDEANQFLKRSYREPWVLKDQV
jgi:predicted dehydrogenase